MTAPFLVSVVSIPPNARLTPPSRRQAHAPGGFVAGADFGAFAPGAAPLFPAAGGALVAGVALAGAGALAGADTALLGPEGRLPGPAEEGPLPPGAPLAGGPV